MARWQKCAPKRRRSSLTSDDAVDDPPRSAITVEAMPLPPRDTPFRAMHEKMPQRLIEQLHEEQAAAGEELSVITDDERFSPGDEIEPDGERKALTLVEELSLRFMSS